MSRTEVRTALLAAASLALLVSPSGAERRWLEEKATVSRQFTLAPAAGSRELTIDNVFGSVDVRPGPGDRVEVTIRQTFSAYDAAEMAKAKREVELEVEEAPGRLVLSQGGSWRCRREEKSKENGDWERGGCCCDHGDRDWQVTYDWTITVPKSLDLTVKTVNDGAIRVEGVTGRLRVRNVNDDVTLVAVAGRVDARTVNGELKVDFATAPTGDLRFGTVNGDIDLGFPKGLGAELSFATLNGEVYTDFAFQLARNPAPPRATERDDRKGRNRHELGRRTTATLGGGGVAIDCDTVNGDITIRERG